MADKRNDYLDAGFSDPSDNDDGYDSEAAELSKGQTAGRSVKRRRLNPDDDDDDHDADALSRQQAHRPASPLEAEEEEDASEDEVPDRKATPSDPPRTSKIPSQANPPSSPQPNTSNPPANSTTKPPKKPKTPGVIYLSSLPPYLKPSALRNLLTQRGFSPITRLFLSPATKAKSTSSKSSRQLYSEGWVEFASKTTARRCAESLNANPIGGKKGGFYHDDLWNMKYLRGMGWAELMAGVREERREEEGRRDEERRVVAREAKGFLEGVEEGRRVEGMRRKRERSGKEAGKGEGVDEGDGKGGGGEVKRTWRQFEAKGERAKVGGVGSQVEAKPTPVDETARRVLSKIF